jgi:V-type H+-transporting ATPase subunit C
MSVWLISIPNDRGSSKQWDELTGQTVGRGLGEVTQFRLPTKNMKVGTLDSLMALSDDIAKVDTFLDNTVKKTEKTVADLLSRDDKDGKGNQQAQEQKEQAVQLFVERDRSMC